MSQPGLSPEPVVFALQRGRGSVALHAGGFRHPGAFGRERFTAYADLTHLAAGSRALRIGTRRGVYSIPRRWFVQPAQMDELVRALLERVVREPTGNVQLARMAEIEETLRGPSTNRVARLLALGCVAVFALEAWIGPAVHHAGFFSAPLVLPGEPWRLLTANLLHSGPLHLAINAVGLLALGSLVERTLGSARTALIAGLAALGSTLAGLFAGYESLVGASGIVAGFAGALLWLELRVPERLPATWRIPRGLFIGALLADALLPLAVPFIAGFAHLGGFAAGLLATALVTGPALRREPREPALSAAVGLVAIASVAALLSAARLLVSGAAWEGHAERLLALEQPSALILNDAAWLIATGRQPTPRALEEARELAERAVNETERQDPNLLDTLAEVQFQSGETESAIDTIDEAIALRPDEPYFREQRRRFTGERAQDDRPAPPPPPLFEPPPDVSPDDEPDSPIFQDEPRGVPI